VWVDGLRWTEVPSFYGAAPDSQVYIVRQRDDGASVVTFGDGERGARLPSGVGNVVATYRFGAGEAAPPAFSIKQLARPVPGRRSPCCRRVPCRHRSRLTSGPIRGATRWSSPPRRATH